MAPADPSTSEYRTELQTRLSHGRWMATLDATRWFIFGEARLAEGC
jgi:hypothetical protein